MDILFTFAGNCDPYNPEMVKGVFTLAGSILQIEPEDFRSRKVSKQSA
jgi:hypothetical protein